MSYGVGIVGTGAVSVMHAIAANEAQGAYLAACYNHNAAKGEAFAAKYGIRHHASLEAFMADPEVDIVVVATPSASHYEACMAAVKAGKKALIVEKPLDASVEKSEAIIKACRENGVMLSGIFQSRFFPSSLLVKKAIEEGRFGTLTLLSCQFKWYRDQAYYDDVPWRGHYDIGGGGVLMNQGIHAIDLMLWFGGDVKSLFAHTATLGHERIDVEDTAAATLAFANGAIGTIEGTTASWPGFLKRVEICGSDGSVILEDESIKAWTFRDERPEDKDILAKYSTSSSPGGANDPMAISSFGHTASLQDVVDALNGKREPFINGEEAIKAVRVVNACYESGRSGKLVRF